MNFNCAVAKPERLTDVGDLCSKSTSKPCGCMSSGMCHLEF